MSYNSPFTGQVIQPTDVSYREITLAANTALSWPINGNVDGNYAARILEVNATSGSLTLSMPPANQTSVGTDALIRNIGANTFTVKDYAGGVILTIAAGQAKYIYITDNPDTAGVWGIIAFGAGSSSVDASALQGYGILALSNTLNQSHPTSALANAYTFSAVDRALARIWQGGVGTATLPAASSLGNNWFTLFKNNGTGSIVLSTTSSELIDGALTKSFAPDESAFIICTGSSFVTVGYGQSANFVFNALVKPVTGGAYTLTPSEASNTIQEYVGSLVSNVTVSYPPVVNFYVISNKTTDNGFSLTITTGVPGGSNAVIPAGQQVTLISDGTNFLNANTTQAGATSISLVNGTVSTPALNFGSETNTGIYHPGAGVFDISVLGSNVAEFSATGLSIAGSGTFSNGISGGAFT